MLDYLDVIQSFKDSFKDKTRRATIAAGGSYGGILAAWMRMKFPDKVQGALASSAPLRWFKGLVNPSAYTQYTTTVFENTGGKSCRTNI